jgi:uncharacterized membrane protein YphA (DoxX/SURF4 family)
MTSHILHTTETVPSNATTALGRHLPTVARFLLGTVFFVFGLNGFLNFIPPPTEPMPEAAVELGTAFVKSGYLFQLIKGTEVVAGVLLLGNRFVPLALVLLAPVVVNIVAFHLWLVPSGLGLSLAVLGLELYLAWVYRRAFAPLLSAKLSTGR